MDRYAGLDWAKDAHQVCVLEEDGDPLIQRSFTHDERDLGAMCELLVEMEVKRIAIERPEGVVVERLLEAGLVVLPVHPNQLKAARPRFRAAGGKSDSFDAFCLAELARTDHRRFRALTPDSDETKALRALTRGALTRAREDLVKTKVSLTNRLQAELDAFWPGAVGVFVRIDSPIALAFLERYPSPTDARALGEKRLQGFLTRHGYCGGKSRFGAAGEAAIRPRGTGTRDGGGGSQGYGALPACRPASGRRAGRAARIADR